MTTDIIPLWGWILFYVMVLIMLLIDLKSFGKNGQHEVSVSEALKMTAELKKVYLKEESALKSMQKTIEKQQRKLNANRRLNQDARENYSQMLEKQQKELGYALREVAERQHSVSDLETSIQNWQRRVSPDGCGTSPAFWEYSRWYSSSTIPSTASVKGR